jgi:Na+-driven multidrug efflux pump
MCASAVLRSAGDPRRAMYITLAGAVVGTIFDAIFILWLGLGIHGAAIAAFTAHLAMMGVGWWGIVRMHDLIARPEWSAFDCDARLIARFAIPLRAHQSRHAGRRRLRDFGDVALQR